MAINGNGFVVLHIALNIVKVVSFFLSAFDIVDQVSDVTFEALLYNHLPFKKHFIWKTKIKSTSTKNNLHQV